MKLEKTTVNMRKIDKHTRLRLKLMAVAISIETAPYLPTLPKGKSEREKKYQSNP